MSARAVPFVGVPPAVQPGDRVWIRDAIGDWRETVAKSEPRYDFENAAGRRCWLTISVRLPDGSTANWPAENVTTEEPA